MEKLLGMLYLTDDAFIPFDLRVTYAHENISLCMCRLSLISSPFAAL